MQPQAISQIGNLVPLVLIFVIFYFMLIRPQRKKEKEQQKMLKGLNKNDEVVTSNGIHGTIVNVKEKTITLRIDDNVKIELERNCVAYIKKPQHPVA
ncbi:MAG: preprotein translocase subunit YajC [Candidatus Omnitrophota bacterium]|nr:preprotein translocase subunit YajC [Candidatus Omnitrophota bacterium]